MDQDYLYADYTMPADPYWEERDASAPLCVKYGDQVCIIKKERTTQIVLEKKTYSENTHKYNNTTEYVDLPDGFSARLCSFIELYVNTLCVFAIDDNMQTCAIYDFDTKACYAYGPLPEALPIYAIITDVRVNMEDNIMSIEYFLDDNMTTVNIPFGLN
jgi:hypothetical protein